MKLTDLSPGQMFVRKGNDNPLMRLIYMPRICGNEMPCWDTLANEVGYYPDQEVQRLPLREAQLRIMQVVHARLN